MSREGPGDRYADDIRVAEDFDESLLHRTPEIDSFLAPGRDDKFIVIDAKGFGKTLLLKATRILYQREGQATCLPSGNLLDKPIGDKISGRESLASFAASPLPWSKVWLAATAVTVLEHVDAIDGLKVCPRLTGLIGDEQLHSKEAYARLPQRFAMAQQCHRQRLFA